MSEQEAVYALAEQAIRLAAVAEGFETDSKEHVSLGARISQARQYAGLKDIRSWITDIQAATGTKSRPVRKDLFVYGARLIYRTLLSNIYLLVLVEYFMPG